MALRVGARLDARQPRVHPGLPHAQRVRQLDRAVDVRGDRL